MDIVIGTHRLLQKDVRFKDLGLVIVDEEHRFGVRHKEQLKGLRTEVDILTLTATPIPRTLNMALGSLRELSLITTPPESRLAIKTFLSTWSAHLIREACLRELKRGGQIYFVHNRIQDIESVGEQVAKIVPEARMQRRPRPDARARSRTGHARLLPPPLRDPGLHGHHRERPRRPHREHDHHRPRRAVRPGAAAPAAGSRRPLAPSGLRIPVAPPREALQGDARKRLEALEALEDLGAGFVLATHDLEIRGAGELLGEDQSGQIQEIGFALYNEMLSRTVRALQDGLDPNPGGEPCSAPDIELHVPALLPEEYLPDIHLRLVLYKRIANARSDAELEALAAELADRFGHIPEPTRQSAAHHGAAPARP